MTPKNPRLRDALLFSLVALCGVLFQLAALRPNEEFLGFQNLSWEAVGSCATGLIDSPPFISLATATAPAAGGCRSNLFPRRGSRLDVSYRAEAKRNRRDRLEIALEDEDGSRLEGFAPIADGKWHFRSLDTGGAMRGGGIRIVIKNGGEGSDLLAVRSRAEYFSRSAFESGARRFLAGDVVSAVLFAISGAALVLTFVRLRNETVVVQYLAFFAIAVLVHYRPYLNFAFDEWHLLDRIVEHGPSSLWIAHNEHFIPAAIALYALEYFVFGAWYPGFILVSLALHAAAAVALIRFFQRLLPVTPSGSITAALLGGFFLIAGLHAEVLQWCMCQGTVLATLAAVLALSAAYDYSTSAENRALFRMGAWSLVALFSFAGSFVLSVQIAAVALFVRFRRVPAPGALPILFVVTGAIFASALYFYSVAQDAGGLKFSDPKVASADKMARYVFRGTQFGTVLRGLGLYSGIEDREIPGAPLGLAVSAILLVSYLLRREERADRIAFWLIGELFLTLPFLITSVARAQFGVQYAVRSLRYQTPALVGLMILILPLVLTLVRIIREDRRTAARTLAGGMLVWYAVAQLSFIARFDTFRDIGLLSRKYLAQLEHWRSLAPGGYEPSFERLTSSPGNYPIHFWGSGERAPAILTPVHPERISAIVRR